MGPTWTTQHHSTLHLQSPFYNAGSWIWTFGGGVELLHLPWVPFQQNTETAIWMAVVVCYFTDRVQRVTR
jgi:hypothetical protein